MSEHPELAAFVCSHVFANEKAVMLVAREDGDWMFLCGKDHAPDEEYNVVGFEHLVDRDPTLHELKNLDDNFEAERTFVGGPWIRIRINEEHQ